MARKAETSEWERSMKVATTESGRGASERRR
jgi:hypothetical protein